MAFPTAPPNAWAIYTDPLGAQHKCYKQKLWASCVPACMAMLVRNTSIIKEAYTEEAARTALKSVMPTGTTLKNTFNDSGISLVHVPDALRKIQINNGVYRTNKAISVASFAQKKPGIVGVTIAAAGSTFKHAMLCLGSLSPALGYLLICPAYGPQLVAAGSLASFQLGDAWNLGTPTPATATPTGEIVELI